MSINTGLFTSTTDQHNTPAWLVDKISDFFDGIGLDPCTTQDNPCRAKSFFIEREDGLEQVWRARTVYMNPPYGRGIGLWTEKLVNEYDRGFIDEAIALLPARTDTKWWLALRGGERRG